MTELIIKAYDVLDELVSLEEFINLKTLNKLIDEKYKSEIKAFKEAQNKFDEIIATGGRHHPDYKEAAKNLSATKKKLYDKKEMLHYRELEIKYQDILNEFLNEMINIISPNIKRKDDYFKGGICSVR